MQSERQQRAGLRVKSKAFQPIIFPLPLVPSRQGRGNGTFYEFVKVSLEKEKNGKLTPYEIRDSVSMEKKGEKQGTKDEKKEWSLDFILKPKHFERSEY